MIRKLSPGSSSIRSNSVLSNNNRPGRLQISVLPKISRTNNRIVGTSVGPTSGINLNPTSSRTRSRIVGSNDGRTRKVWSELTPRRTSSRIVGNNDDQLRRTLSQRCPETSGMVSVARQIQSSIQDQMRGMSRAVRVRDGRVVDVAGAEAKARLGRRTRIRSRWIQGMAVNRDRIPANVSSSHGNKPSVSNSSSKVGASNSSNGNDQRLPRMARVSNDSGGRAELPRVAPARLAARVLPAMSGHDPSSRHRASQSRTLVRIHAIRSGVLAARTKRSIAPKSFVPCISADVGRRASRIVRQIAC